MASTCRHEHNLEVLALQALRVRFYEHWREALTGGAPTGRVVHPDVLALERVTCSNGAVVGQEITVEENLGVCVWGVGGFGVRV